MGDEEHMAARPLSGLLGRSRLSHVSEQERPALYSGSKVPLLPQRNV